MQSAIAEILTMLLGGLLVQDPPPIHLAPQKDVREPSDRLPREIQWHEGLAIRVRVPVTAPGRELMTGLAFPEEAIEAAITGWESGEITAIQKHGLLFLRLAKKSEGQLNVIGASGTHYLLYLVGVDTADPDAYDSYLKIQKKPPTPAHDVLPKHLTRRPSTAVDLVQTMRLGLHPESVKILRAKRELAYESTAIEMRLIYVYDAQEYWGFVYEVRNRTDVPQSVDASRLHAKGMHLVLSALKENVVPPQASTRLYTLLWKD